MPTTYVGWWGKWNFTQPKTRLIDLVVYYGASTVRAVENSTYDHATVDFPDATVDFPAKPATNIWVESKLPRGWMKFWLYQFFVVVKTAFKSYICWNFPIQAAVFLTVHRDVRGMQKIFVACLSVLLRRSRVAVTKTWQKADRCGVSQRWIENIFDCTKSAKYRTKAADCN